MGEPGLLSCLAETHKPLCSSSHGPAPGQISLTYLSMAQSAQSSDSAHAAGKVKPRMELIFFSIRNNLSCPMLVWKFDARKQGNSSQVRSVLCSTGVQGAAVL